VTAAPVHPRIAGATRRQLETWRAALDAGARRVGWKLAFGIEEVEALVGDDPAIGHITSRTVLPPGGTFTGAAAVRRLVAETELAVAAGDDATVAGLAVALEVVDTARPPDGLEPILADNAYHRAVAFGPVRACTVAGAHARLRVGHEVAEVRCVTSDPAAVLAAASRLLLAAGERLCPGDLVLAGSACHVPVAPGDTVTAEIDGLSPVAITIAP
jgi:2-oxo-3-hexenedioate decarboxylase